jgi:hypothetical protein
MGGKMNTLNENIYSVASINFKLLRQITENPINVIYAYLKLIISVSGGHYDCSPQA